MRFEGVGSKAFLKRIPPFPSSFMYPCISMAKFALTEQHAVRDFLIQTTASNCTRRFVSYKETKCGLRKNIKTNKNLRQDLPAAQGLQMISEITKKTANAMTHIACSKLRLRCKYCSQKVNAIPDGKFGRPSFAN